MTILSLWLAFCLIQVRFKLEKIYIDLHNRLVQIFWNLLAKLQLCQDRGKRVILVDGNTMIRGCLNDLFRQVAHA